MNRFVDRGAIIAAYVGIGMAVTIAFSFLLIIPIEPVVWFLALPAGLLIGYYANARPCGRAVRGAGSSSTAVRRAGDGDHLRHPAARREGAVLLHGRRVPRRVGRWPASTCTTGADCVYQRYLAAGRATAFEANGITDVATFTSFYWTPQLGNAGMTFLLSVGGALGGGVMFGLANRRKPEDSAAPDP